MILIERRADRSNRRFFGFLVFLLLLSGCFSQTRALVAPVAGPAVASVNGAIISAKELDAAIDRLIPRSSYHRKITEEKRNEFRDKALDDLIIAELQYQDAVTRGMKPAKKSVNTRLDKIRERFNSKKEYKQALERSGLREDQLRFQIEKAVLIEAVIQETINERAAVSEEELKNYYNDNISDFKQPESMRLRIITSSEENKAKQALSRLQAGEDFSTVAGTVSEDDYRINGGDIGYIHRGRIYPELEIIALKMKTGDIHGPIKAENKWFIIKLEDRKPAREVSFAETHDKLKKELEKKRSDGVMEQWISKLKGKASIEVINQN